MTDDRNPKPVVVGRTWADLMATSETGPKLDAAMAGIVDFFVTAPGKARERIARLFRRVDAELEASGVEPKAIPERVAIPVMEAASLEEREEIQELFAQILVGSACGREVDQFQINLVRQLSPDAARILVAVRSVGARALLPRLPRPKDEMMFLAQHELRSYAVVTDAVPDKARRDTAIGRLVALGLLEEHPPQPKRDDILAIMPSRPDVYTTRACVDLLEVLPAPIAPTPQREPEPTPQADGE